MDERVCKKKASHTGTPLASDANLDLMQKLHLVVCSHNLLKEEHENP